MSVTVVIPAYNEAESIARTVGELKALGPEYRVLVVDDGSRDDTAARARGVGAEAIVHPYNKGYGAALKTGIRSAASDLIVIFDADGQHDAKDIPRMLAMMDEYDMVVGDRGRAGATPRHRVPGKWVLDRVAGFLVDHPIPDLNSGFRCFRRDTARKFFPLLPNGFSFSTTITLAFFKEGLNVAYVPIAARKREQGRSEVKYLRDGAKTLLLIARITALFNPLKIFAPVGLFLIGVGGIYGLYGVFTISHIQSGAVLAILAGILIILFGILADQIACIRRQIGSTQGDR
jgi:glycosyltransferase involved in cell wall biosynthesis